MARKQLPFGLYQRGNTWWCRVPETPGGPSVRKSTGCEDLEAAKLRAAQLEREGTTVKTLSQSVTLETAIRGMIEQATTEGKAIGTINMYSNSGEWLCKVIGKDTPLSQITARELDDYLAIRRKQTPKPADHSLYKDLVCMRQTLKRARRRGEYDHPIDMVMPIQSANYKPRTRHLTSDEAAKLISELPAERKAQILFILATGARWSEMERAELADINFAKGSVHIRGTKTEGSKRDLPINVGHVKAMLESVAKDPYIAKTGPMFPNWTNSRRGILKACKRAGIDPVSANDLRRTPPSWLVQARVDSRIVALYLGHKTTRMVELVYGQPGDKLGEMMSDALDSKLGRKLVKAGASIAKTQPQAATVLSNPPVVRAHEKKPVIVPPFDPDRVAAFKPKEAPPIDGSKVTFPKPKAAPKVAPKPSKEALQAFKAQQKANREAAAAWAAKRAKYQSQPIGDMVSSNPIQLGTARAVKDALEQEDPTAVPWLDPETEAVEVIH